MSRPDFGPLTYVNRCWTSEREGAPLRISAQCDMSTGTVMLRSKVRVAPPSMISRTRECP
jgi:hypothetical protein